MKNLHVFTNKFPYENSGEDTFLIPEMRVLSKEFNIVFYVKQRGEILKDLPFKFEICYDFTYEKKNKIKLTVNLVLLIFKELLLNPQLIFSLGKVKELMVILSDNIKNSNSFLSYFQSNIFNSECDIFYTYWFDEWNNILSYLKKENNDFKKFKLISRVHGFDLYNYRSKYFKIPFRNNQLKYSDKIVSISLNGYKYLIKNHPLYNYKFNYSRLGTVSAGLNPLNNSNTFVLVSCSSIIPLKRVDRIVNLLMLLKIKVKWYHFGDGPLFETIKLSTKSLNKNISVRMMGKIDNKEILKFYSKTPVNLFINLSEFEGIPVSIMEAISFSIPVIATNVGGVSEIVTEESGLLFDKDPNLNKIADIINNFSIQEIFNSEFRNKVLNFWKYNYNSELNFNFFSNIIKNLHDLKINERV